MLSSTACFPLVRVQRQVLVIGGKCKTEKGNGILFIYAQKEDGFVEKDNYREPQGELSNALRVNTAWPNVEHLKGCRVELFRLRRKRLSFPTR